MKNFNNTTAKVLPKEIVDSNQMVIDVVHYYSKVSDIIERTHIAMGKKKIFTIQTASTTAKQKLNTDLYGPTNQKCSRV